MPSQAQIDFYNANGYLVVEDVLDAPTLAELRRVTERIVASAAGVTGHTDFLDLEPSHTPGNPRVRRIKSPHRADPFYRRLAAHPAIMAVLEPLIGPDIRLLAGGKVNIKAAGHGAPVEWHQDWAFYPHTNDDVLAVGLLLDDIDMGNAPMRVLPGSHLGPLYDHHTDGAFCGAMDPTAIDLDFSRAVALTGKAGSMTVHHARAIHGSPMNTSNRQRRLLLFEYSAADAWPIACINVKKMLEDFDEFNSRVVHGKPTLQARLTPVPVRVPLPAARHQGSIYENQRAVGHQFFEHDPDRARVAAG